MATEIISTVKQFILEQKLIKPHDKIIVGLSGGPDSVFLVHLLKIMQAEFNITLIAVHLDHEWRAESAQDAEFCKQLAAELNLVFVLGKASEITLTKKYSGSQEELGRALRRQFFAQVMREYNAQSVALAHHADDQQETFFIRLIRGATLSGLASMRPRAGCIIRPLLMLYKREILDYLHTHALAYRHDITNEQPIFLRNTVRHNILPALHKADKRFDKNFAKTLAHIQQTESFLEKLTAQEFSTLITTSINSTHTHTTDTTQITINSTINIDKLLTYDSFLQTRLVLKWLCTAQVPFSPSTSLLQEILRFLHQPGSKTHVFYGGQWVVVKQKQQAYIIKHVDNTI